MKKENVQMQKLEKIKINSLNFCHMKNLLPPREKNSYKNSNGRLFLGAGYNAIGAGVMAASSAYVSGAGMVYTDNKAIVEHVPEVILMNDEVNAQSNIKAALWGPGCGINENGISEILTWLGEEAYLVFDADGIGSIAQSKMLRERLIKRGKTVYTPHLGEARSMLISAVEDKLVTFTGEEIRIRGVENHFLLKSSITKDDFLKMQAPSYDDWKMGSVLCVVLGIAFNCGIILKGSSSLLFDGEGLGAANQCNEEISCIVWKNNITSKVLAQAGSGDVLSGLLTGFLAQGIDKLNAMKLACFYHSMGARYGSIDMGIRGMNNSLLPVYVAQAMKSME